MKPLNGIRTKYQKLDDYLKPCELMPDDKAFIFQRLPSNTGFRKTVLNGYKEKWLNAMQLEGNTIRKQNMGRRASNTWLRLNYPVLRVRVRYA